MVSHLIYSKTKAIVAWYCDNRV